MIVILLKLYHATINKGTMSCIRDTFLNPGRVDTYLRITICKVEDTFVIICYIVKNESNNISR